MISPVVNWHMNDLRDLERIYREARYQVDLPSGMVEFGIGGAIDGLAGQPLAVITAYNPRSTRPTTEENAAANARLQQRLDHRELECLPARGMNAERTHIEPSFAVFGIERRDALDLAREFCQAAIVWFDGETAELAWTSEAPPAAGT